MAALAVVLCLVTSSQGLAQADRPPIEAESSSARALVHLLDYIAQDYPEAVSNGEVVSEMEYAEMQEFAVSVSGLLQELSAGGVLPEGRSLQALSEQLGAGIAGKEAPEEVASLARSMREEVIRLTGLQVAPLQWPDPANGQALYAQNCVTCHGDHGAGDGPLAPGLTPRPTNLVGGERIAALAPFQVYNTIRLGVEGTAMSSFTKLTDREVWDLAFFVKSLQSADEHPEARMTDPAALRALKRTIPLQQVATLGDRDLTIALDTLGVLHPASARAALRMAGPGQEPGSSLTHADRYLKEARLLYQRGETAQARQRAIVAYLEGVEPAEPTLKAVDATLATVLETRMMDVRSAIEQARSLEDVSQAVDRALITIEQAREVLKQQEPSAWFAFLMAASILLREGLEAFLVILAILGVLRAVGERQAARWVHGGWMLAVLLGAVAWFYSDLLIRFGAAQRELMEGGISLLAVGVLLYVGFWLHSKTEIRKWKEFIDERVKRMVNGRNLVGLAAISFFAVFREAFESVLFLSALTLEEGAHSKLAIVAGAVLAIAAVLVLAAILLRFSARLPIKNLFRYSSFVMGVLSVILMGKGIHAVQETGLLSITTAPFTLRLGFLGVYPTVETLVAQMSILVLVVLLWTLPKWRAWYTGGGPAPRLG